MSNTQQLLKETEQRITGLETARATATGSRKSAITKKLARAYTIRASIQALLEQQS